MQEKNLGLEQLVFFGDAVVAINIPLLSPYLKFITGVSGDQKFYYIGALWKKFGASLLSLRISDFTGPSLHRCVGKKIVWANNEKGGA